jgi:hypothetical protein
MLIELICWTLLLGIAVMPKDKVLAGSTNVTADTAADSASGYPSCHPELLQHNTEFF